MSIEPRIGITKEVKDGVFSLAFGKHSQVEHFATYMYQNENGFTPNKNIHFAKAYQVFGLYKSKTCFQMEMLFTENMTRY